MLADQGIGKVLLGIGFIIGVVAVWIATGTYKLAKWGNLKRRLLFGKKYVDNYFYQTGDQALGPYKFGELVTRIPN